MAALPKGMDTAERLMFLEAKLDRAHEVQLKKIKEEQEFALFQTTIVEDFSKAALGQGGTVILKELGMYSVQWIATFFHDEMNKFHANIIYAVVSTILFPPITYSLSGPVTKSGTMCGDTLALVKGAVASNFGWSWMKVLSSVMTFHKCTYFPWYESLIAIGVTLFMSFGPAFACFRKAQAAAKAADAATAATAADKNDSLFGRFLILPTLPMVCLGFVWNNVMSWYRSNALDALPADTAPGKREMYGLTVHFFYFMALSGIAVAITIGWARHKSRQVQMETGQVKEESSSSSSEEEERLDTFVKDVSQGANEFNTAASSNLSLTMSLVFGCALESLLQEFFFKFLIRCSSQMTCSYSMNLLFAVLLSVFMLVCLVALNAEKAKSVKAEKAENELADTFKSFLIFGGGFVVGGAWGGYFKTLMTEFLSGTVINPVLPPLGEVVKWYLILFVGFWIVTAGLYHFLMEMIRRYKRQLADGLAAFSLEGK